MGELLLMPDDKQDELYHDPYDEEYSESFEEQPEVDSGLSVVATAKAKSIVIMVLVGIASVFFLYKMLFEEEKELIRRSFKFRFW